MRTRKNPAVRCRSEVRLKDGTQVVIVPTRNERRWPDPGVSVIQTSTLAVLHLFERSHGLANLAARYDGSADAIGYLSASIATLPSVVHVGPFCRMIECEADATATPDRAE